MFEKSRHVPLRSLTWDPGEAAHVIQEILSDALDHFDRERFWSSHPMEDGVPDGNPSLYLGATGMVWALQYLARIGATEKQYDFRPALPQLIERSRWLIAQRPYSGHGSLLFGDMGTLLVAMSIEASASLADDIYALANANTELPIRELMWGMPGSMLACIFMSEMTKESRWRALYEGQTARLLDELEETDDGPLWTQELYVRRDGRMQPEKRRWLGPVHGYAGNMIPLIRGWAWLTDAQRARVADAIPRTLSVNAWHGEMGTTWSATAARDPPKLCQHCHGAPGMVTTFADAPFTEPALESLLVGGGDFIWHVGPLAKGSNLCHGTAGNGYAFLKLYRRTKNADWLQRARDFAMTAISQYREAREQYGKGRYSLWTGDMGLAIYLWDCLTTEPRFPIVDVF